MNQWLIKKGGVGFKGTLIVLFSQLFCNSFCSNAKILPASLGSTKKQLEEFIFKKDTNQLSSTLKFMSNHFENFNSTDNLNLLLRVSKEESKLSFVTLKDLFLLIRRYYNLERDYSKNFEYTLKAYNVLVKTKDHEGTMWILIDLGNVFYEELDYQQSEKFYKKAQKSALLAKSNYGLGVITLNLGLIKERFFLFEDALDYYEESVNYRTWSGQISSLSHIYTKIADCNLKLGKPEICIDYIRRAENNFYQQSKSPSEFFEVPYFIFYMYAEYFASQREFNRASYYMQKGIDYANKNQMIYEELMGNIFKAECYYKNGQYQQAISSLNKFLPFFKKYKVLKYQRNIFDILRKCYSALHDEKNATLCAEKYVLIDDSLKRNDSDKKLEMMRSIVSVNKTNLRLAKTRKSFQLEKVNNAAKAHEKRKYFYIALSCVICVFLFFVIFLVSQKNKLKMIDLHNRLLEQNNRIKVNAFELKKSKQLKDNLFFIISNDLSTPLNNLKSDLQILRHSMVDKKIAGNIESTLDETIHLFEGLLVWSKADQNHKIYNPTKVSLDVNINKVISFFQYDTQSRNIIVINKSAVLFTFADQNILQTLLRNVISNAIAVLNKTTQKGEKKIEIETLVHNKYLIELVVSDSGPGFPAHILQQFNQLDYEINSSRSGLGLSICKVLTKMSGWKMEIANDRIKGGANISIFMPIYNQEDTNIPSKELRFSQEIKNAFVPLFKYKVYQTSEIKTFLKSLEYSTSEDIKDWIIAIENAVKEGDQKYYSQLLGKLNKNI